MPTDRELSYAFAEQWGDRILKHVQAEVACPHCILRCICLDGQWVRPNGETQIVHKHRCDVHDKAFRSLTRDFIFHQTIRKVS